MKELCFLLLAVCVCTQARVQYFNNTVPALRRCNVRYDEVLQYTDWPCNDPRFQTYPKMKVDTLLNTYRADPNDPITKYLDYTKNCQTYHDPPKFFGGNQYYSFSSICKLIRREVRVLWTHVEGYMLTPEQQSWNQGLLPVHVIEGQNLFDVKCIHPLSEDVLPNEAPAWEVKIAKKAKWNEVTRHLCKVGYMYNPNYVCKPSGYINRDILVYSEHANKVFIKHLKNVPTACSCIKCKCR